MSIFDDKPELPNIIFPTLGGEVFWTELDRQSGYVLQQNDITGHCRILDAENCRVAWGVEGPMRAKLKEFAPVPFGNRPQYGDVIGVHRIGGAYDHYGIYESDDCVYEYAAKDHDFGEANIHVTTLKNFIRDSGNCFVLTFPSQHGTPGKLDVSSYVAGLIPQLAPVISLGPLIDLSELFRKIPYHLYTPEETIQRARSRLGETKYDLIFNNCEHFAIWCKTGIHESHQVDEVAKVLALLHPAHIS